MAVFFIFITQGTRVPSISAKVTKGTPKWDTTFDLIKINVSDHFYHFYINGSKGNVERIKMMY